MQADEPGAALRLVEGEIPEPGAGHVRVTVEAAGICHSDAMFLAGHMPGVTFPLVTGHEIDGRIDAIGDGVQEFRLGQCVAVGWCGGNCGHCMACREGDAINCAHLQIAGLSYPGGFAEIVVARLGAGPYPRGVHRGGGGPDGLRWRDGVQRAAAQRRPSR